MACEVDLSAIWPDDVEFIVGVANPLVNEGVPVQAGDSSFVIDSMKGWKVRLFRNAARQTQINPLNGDTYYNYTSLSAEFTLSKNALDEEVFAAEAYKPA